MFAFLALSVAIMFSGLHIMGCRYVVLPYRPPASMRDVFRGGFLAIIGLTMLIATVLLSGSHN